MINSGDTAWVLISAALVFLMTPGLAFFYGGLVRRKNVLSILMQCFAAMCAVSLQWVLIGYSLSFAPSTGFWGGLQWLGLRGVGALPFNDYSATIPHQAFVIFQMMFAIITPALIIGAFAERMKFSAYLFFILAWSFLVYNPVCHWIWGMGGWLKNMGILDFAGGTVIHINAGIASLAAALVLGRRLDYRVMPKPPHNLPFTVLGAGLLWFGWFGFNGGSALGANSVAVNAFLVTNTAAATAGLTWIFLEWKFTGTPTMLGAVTGAVAGLAGITQGAGYVGVMPAVLIGAMASVFCFIAVAWIKPKFGYDDSLDAFGVHGISGIWGAIAVGLFASKGVNPAGADGLFYGNAHQFFVQLAGAAAVTVYAFTVSFILLKIISAVMGARAGEKEENIGLDLSQHHEGAYTVLE